MARIDYKGIADAADMERVASAMGYDINSRHKVLCPFHTDTKPSLHIYHDGYHCFVCGAHGDAIDFVQAVRGCDKAEAAETVARICGGDLYVMDDAAMRRDAAITRQQDEYDRAYAAFADAEENVAGLESLIGRLTPYSAAWVAAWEMLNTWLWRREVADLALLYERCKRYDRRKKRRADAVL